MKYLLKKKKKKKKKKIFKAGEFKIHISQKLLKITVTDFCLQLRILTAAFVFRRWNFFFFFRRFWNALFQKPKEFFRGPLKSVILVPIKIW